MLKNKNIVCLIFATILMISMVSAVELKIVKVENLRAGDIIVDKNGNEIVIQKIESKPSESLTISEYLKQKINIDLKKEDSLAIAQVAVSGSEGPGSITGNVIANGKAEIQEVGKLTKLINKLISWFSR